MQSKQSSTSAIDRPSRPKPKTGFIPPQALGDILQIWNFFNTFSELFKCDDIKLEEIYACLIYKGEESLGLLNDMHQGILSLYLQEYLKHNKFEAFKDRTENPFFVLLKSRVGNKDLDGDELALIWTEFARKMVNLQPCSELFSETTKRYFELLGKKGCLEYNTLDYRMKIKILINLIEGLYETDYFRGLIQEKMEVMENLIKGKNEFQQEIKQDEQTCKELRAKFMLKSNSKNTWGVQQLQNELIKQEEIVNRKREKLDQMTAELSNPLQTAFLIGSDVHRSEYWVFQAEPAKLYVRCPEIVSTEEEWYYYDTKVELDQLIQSLNPKGTKEKRLLEGLDEFIATGKLNLREESMLIVDDKENIPPEKRQDKDNKDKMEEDKTLESSYWFAKVMEYDELPKNDSNARTTRRKQQMEQLNRGPISKRKSPKDLNMETIKAALLETEEKLNIYVAKWNSWWAFPKVREEVLNRLLEIQTLPDLRDLLLELNEHFKYGNSYRQKTQSQADTNSTEDRSKLSEEGKDEEEDSNDEQSADEKVDDDSSRSKGVSNGQTMEIEEIHNRKIRKYPMRFWGMYTDKLKSSWINYTTGVDTIDGVFFSTMMFCETINAYVDRMNIRYFTLYKDGKEYMEAKYGSKKQAKDDPPLVMTREKRVLRTRYRDLASYDSLPESPEPEKRAKSKKSNLQIENLDNFRHAKKVVSKKVVKENRSEGKSTADSDTFAGRLRSRDRSQTPSEERTYPLRRQQPKGNISKMEEIANVRKSSRLNKQTTLDVHNEFNEEEEERFLESSMESTALKPTRRSARRIS